MLPGLFICDHTADIISSVCVLWYVFAHCIYLCVSFKLDCRLGMLTSLDRDESRKKFSGSRKKFLSEKFLDPKF